MCVYVYIYIYIYYVALIKLLSDINHLINT